MRMKFTALGRNQFHKKVGRDLLDLCIRMLYINSVRKVIFALADTWIRRGSFWRGSMRPSWSRIYSQYQQVARSVLHSECRQAYDRYALTINTIISFIRRECGRSGSMNGSPDRAPLLPLFASHVDGHAGHRIQLGTCDVLFQAALRACHFRNMHECLPDDLQILVGHAPVESVFCDHRTDSKKMGA